jgi:hypothetical protein
MKNAVNQRSYQRLVNLKTSTVELVWPESQEAMKMSFPLVSKMILNAVNLWFVKTVSLVLIHTLTKEMSSVLDVLSLNVVMSSQLVLQKMLDVDLE